jgi:hypothetical protein
MANVRMRNPLPAGDFDPTTADYTPPNGNTGIGGYGPGGIEVPPLDQPYPVPGTGDDHGGVDVPPPTLPEGGGTKPPIFTSRPRSGSQGSADRPRTQGTGGGYLPDAGDNTDKPTTANQEFNGDYLGYIRSLLPGTVADRSAVDDIEDELAKVGITNQRASDGTSRGRVHLPNGQYVDLVHGTGWGDTWADLQARDPYVEHGGGGGSTPTPAQSPFSNPDLMAQLQAIFGNAGNFNEDIVNRRTENAGAALRRSANSRKANNMAYLAERGLVGDGPEGSMVGRVDESIANQYADAVSGIYADESAAADQRMMEALSLATGMSTADADRALGYFRANNDYTLGQGNLALQNSIASNNYNLGLGNFGLDRDRLMHDIDSGNVDQLIELLKLYLGGAQTSAGGHY